MTSTEAAAGSFTQLLVLSLLVERVVQVVRILASARPTAWDDPQDPEWGRSQIAIAFCLALLILGSARFDVLQRLLGPEGSSMWLSPFLGVAVGALVTAGGSAAIRKIIEALKPTLKLIYIRARVGASGCDDRNASVAAGTHNTPTLSGIQLGARWTALPPVGNPKAQKVIDVCELEWPANSSDCSGFVRDVAEAFSFPLEGNADSIVDQITSGDWQRLRDGAAAKAAADDGQLVVAGLKSNDHAPRDDGKPVEHGHVVIVVSGDLAHERYPTAYWGTLGGIGRKRETINWAWRKVDRDKVIFACCRI
jgi:hypothetical protein